MITSLIPVLAVSEILLGIVVFTGVTLLLVVVILIAKARLVESGDITIQINDDPDKTLTVAAGGKLMNALSSVVQRLTLT